MTIQIFFAALLALLAGAAFCFWGYRVFLVMLPVWGFVAGFWLGAEFFQLIFGSGFLATTSSWVVGLVLGILGAIFSYMFYWLGVIFVAASIGAGLGSGLMKALGLDADVLVISVAIVAGVITAFLAWRYNLQRIVIMALTAVLGASFLVLAPLLLFGGVTLEALRLEGSALMPIVSAGWLWTLVWLALAVAGLLFQLRTGTLFTFAKEDYVEGWS